MYVNIPVKINKHLSVDVCTLRQNAFTHNNLLCCVVYDIGILFTVIVCYTVWLYIPLAMCDWHI